MNMNWFSQFVLILMGLLLHSFVWGHGGEIEINTSSPQGPVHLTKTQIAALDLKTVEATERPIATLLPLNGEVKLMPNAQADISTRISGQVTAVYVTVGDVVKKGQVLAKIQSRLVGDPPPTIDVLSSMAGIIDARNINIGQTIEPNIVLFHVSDRTQMQVVAHVYEEDLGKIQIGQSSTLRVLGYPNQLFTGKVSRIDPNLDPLTRTSQVWIDVENSKDLLKPNMFVKVNIFLSQNATTLTIPNGAIIESNGEKFVFVQNIESFQRTEITTGASDDQFTEILNGLVPGDQVVTQGNRELYTFWLTGGHVKAKE